MSSILLKSCVPVLKTQRNSSDISDEYKIVYGCLGVHLYEIVVKARKAQMSSNMKEVMHGPHIGYKNYCKMDRPMR